MNARPPPNELLPWALGQLALDAGHADSHPQAVAGDASNRRYFRAALGGRSRILVEAPPGTEKNAEFLAVRALLAAAGVRVPALYGSDLQRGYLLLEDLGDRLLLPELTTGSVDAAYRRAMDVLLRMAALETAGLDIPHYDAALLQEELGRFPAWFAEALLGHAPDEQERGLLHQLDSLLVASALEQPQVLVHRDFHSRNLMPQADGALAVIDFQDAVAGPVTYDLVSLLRDCYVRWPAARVRGWALDYRARLQAAGLLFSGSSPDGRLAEVIELPGHPFFVASQFHPEFKSKPFDPHPLFEAFVRAAGRRAESKKGQPAAAPSAG